MINQLLMKTCSRCSTSKPPEGFPKNKRKSDGLDPACKDCTNARMRAAYALDPAKKVARTRKYHLDHPEWSKERLRASHLRHQESRAARAKERGKNPTVQAQRRDSTRRAEQRRRAIKASSTQVDLITAEALDDRLVEFDNRCYICETEFCSTIKLHWDHFQPLARGGLHVLDNLFPACGPCNIRKNAVWPVTESRLAEIKTAVLALREPALVTGRR